MPILDIKVSFKTYLFLLRQETKLISWLSDCCVTG